MTDSRDGDEPDASPSNGRAGDGATDRNADDDDRERESGDGRASDRSDRSTGEPTADRSTGEPTADQRSDDRPTDDGTPGRSAADPLVGESTTGSDGTTPETEGVGSNAAADGSAEPSAPGGADIGGSGAALDGNAPTEAELDGDADGREDPDVPSPNEQPLRWFRTTDNGAVTVFKDVATSVAIVAAIGLVLFLISGVWPPLVAIESGSMDPHMQKGDLVFIMDNDRMTPDEAVTGTGVVTYERAQETGYTKFGDYGDVIIFERGGQSTPIIHRAHLYVEEGENWYDRADPDYVRADNCDQLRNCPAPQSGFVTKGDNVYSNPHYDQANRHEIVSPDRIQGTAEVRIPYLGCIRLEFSNAPSCRSDIL